MKTVFFLFFWLTLSLFSYSQTFTGYLLGNPSRQSIASETVGFGVNATTGNYFYSTVDHEFPGTEIRFIFGRSYNLLASSTDSFGNSLPAPFGNHRWTHTYNVVLTFNGTGDRAEVYWGDGRRDGFIKTAGVWQAATPGNFLKLEEIFSGGVSWQIRSRNRLVYQFDTHSAYARLSKIISRSGHELTVHYNASDELSQITDTHGRVTTFSYSSNMLQTVTLPVADGRSFSYTYSNIGDLSSFVDMRSNAWSYTYNNGELIRVYEGGANPAATDGVIIQNSYTNDDRVETQKPGFLIGNTKQYEFTWNDGLSFLDYTTPEGSIYRFQRDADHRLTEIKQLSISGSPTYTKNYQTGSATAPESVHLDSTNDYRGNDTEYDNYNGLIPRLVTFADMRTVNIALNEAGFNDPSVVTSATQSATRYEDYHPLYEKPRRIIVEQPVIVQGFSPNIQYNILHFGGTQAGLISSIENNDSNNSFEQVDYTYKTGTSLVETETYFLDGADFTKKLVITHDYDVAGRRISTTDYRGTKTYFYYDNNDNLTDIISGGTWATAPLTSTAATSNIDHVRYVYDEANRRIERLNHFGSSKQRRMKYEYGSQNLQLIRTFDDSDKRQTIVDRFTDDVRPFRIQIPGRDREDQFHQSLDRTKTVEFLNAKHNNIHSDNTDYQYIRRKEYDAQGNLISIGYATGVDDKASPTSDVTTNQLLLQMGHDEVNRITSLTMTLEANGTNPSVTRDIQYNHDDEGRKITVTYLDDSLGAKKVYEFDASGALYRVTELDNAKTIVAETYRDPAGRIIRMVQPATSGSANTFETNYTHNGIGDVLTKTEPHFGLTSYDYDYANGIVVESWPSGFKFRRTYNRLNQLVQVESTSNNFATILNAFTYSYDEAGNLQQENWSGQSGTGSRSYTWNVYGEVTAVSDPSSVNITYLRDVETGDLTNTQFAGYDLSYVYNVFGQAKSLTVKKDGTTLGQFQFDYESIYGSLRSCQFPNGYETVHLYNAQNELTQKHTGLSGQSKILNYTIERNGRGLQNKIDVLAQPLAPKLFDLNLPYTRSNTTDLLQQIGGHNVTHDTNANVTGVAGLNVGPFTFDEFRRFEGNGSSVAHSYDSGTNRASTTRDGVTTKYLTDVSGTLPNIIATLDGTNTPTEVFLYGPGGLIGSVKDGQIRGVHCDTNANVVALSDPSAALIRKYMYSPFGELVNREGARDFPFRFAGGVGCFSDPEGSVSMRARVYHPTLKQFLSPDPFPGFFSRSQSLQKYAYVEGQVLGKNDPSGQFWSAVITAGFAIYDTYQYASGNISDKEYAEAMALNGAALLADIGTAGNGGGLAVRAANATVRTAKAIDKAHTIYSTGEGIVVTGQALAEGDGSEALVNGLLMGAGRKARGRTPRPKDGSSMGTNDALDEAESFLGPNYTDKGGGRFVSKKGDRQIRLTDDDLAKKNNHAGAPHMNFEEGKTIVKPNGKESFVPDEGKNSHIYLPEEQ